LDVIRFVFHLSTFQRREGSAFGNDTRKDVWVLPVIVAVRKLSKVQRRILFADLMERADHATLEQTPGGFAIVGMNVPAHISLFWNGS
jgi:hypothetical protein